MTIVLAAVDPTTVEAVEKVEIAGEVGVENTSPTVASTRAGSIVVAWAERDPMADETNLKATRLDRDLIFTAGEIHLSSVSFGLLTPFRSYAAEDESVIVEWEVLGGTEFGARRSSTIALTNLITNEALVSSWDFDPPAPEVAGDDE